MKRLAILLFLAGALLGGGRANAQTGRITHEKEIIDSLNTIDPEIVKYFPRWKVCEPDIQLQLEKTFLFNGFKREEINAQNIEILAAPREFNDQPFEILVISCGKAKMSPVEVEAYLGDKLLKFIAGELIYSGINRGGVQEPAKRDYCFQDIPIEQPLKPSQAEAIVNYMEPSNKKQSITLSLFDQVLKVGQTGFYIKSIFGTDQIGLPYWTSGMAKVVLQRPLYLNQDLETRESIQYLISAYFGGGYKITAGAPNAEGNPTNKALSWVSARNLNGSEGGQLVAGFDFHMPFHPQLGVSFNVEVPMKSLKDNAVDEERLVVRPINPEVADINFDQNDPRFGSKKFTLKGVSSFMRGSGQVSAFYHWWLDKRDPENYFKFNIGLSYSEVADLLVYRDEDNTVTKATRTNVVGLTSYKPSEFGDWLFLKADYRNQAVFPFGVSFQYSNQILLSKLWIPLFNDWLYLEAKYSTPLRNVRPYEVKSFFMISPVLRLTI